MEVPVLKQSKRRKIERQPLTPLPERGARIGYARVSTDDQSLDLQLTALREFGCHRIFEEKVSSVSRYRPKLKDALESLRNGDTLAIWKLDRLARSLLDLKRLIETIEEKGAILKSLTQSEIDTSNTTGRLLLNILGTVAEFERDIISDRTKAGINEARRQGKQIGAKPKLSSEQRRQAQKDRNAGMSIRQLAEKYDCSPGTIQVWTVPRKRRARAR